MDAVILAGGKGSRMNINIPKCLVKVDHRTILDLQLEYLLLKCDKIILSLGHLAPDVIDYINQNYSEHNIEYVVEESPLGTAGGVRLAMDKTTSDKILVLNCDDITNIDISKLGDSTHNTICVAHPTLPFGLVKEDGDGFAIFEEKPVLKDWVSCGWYLFQRNEIYPILPETGMLEYDVFPQLKLKIFHHEGFWAPVNNPKELKRLQEFKQIII